MKSWLTVLFLLLAVTTVFAAQQATERVDPENDIECSLCKWLVEKVEDWVTASKTESEVINYLDTLCDDLPSTYANYCTALINEYGTELINLILQEEDPSTVCTQLGICTSEVAIVDANDLECSICKWLVGKLEDYVKQNKTESQIINYLDGICDELPKSWRKECTSLVNEYGTQIIDLILQAEDPSQICIEIGLCTSTADNGATLCEVCKYVMALAEKFLEEERTEEEIESFLDTVCDYLPKTMKNECKTLIDEYTPEIIEILVNKEDPQTVCTQIDVCTELTSEEGCEVCKAIVGYVEHFLSQSGTEDEIEKLLHKACNWLPAQYFQTCEQMIDSYLPLLISYIEKVLPPEKVCELLTVCETNFATEDDEFCMICEVAMKYVEHFLAENSTQEEIEAVLEKVCTYLPKTYVSTCDLIIEEYTPLIVEYILNNEKPDAICTLIGLCHGSSASMLKESNGEFCLVCEAIMTYLDHFLSENASEAEIEDLLDKVCAYLPKSYVSTCDLIVSEYTPLIIQYILDDASPDKICALLGLCDSKTEDDDELCMVCEVAMTFLEHLLSDNATQAEIEKLLDEICNYLPAAYYQTCLQMIDEYEDLIVKFILDDLPPKKICEEIGLCTDSVEILGAQSPNGLVCWACKKLMKYLINYLPVDAGEKEIEELLEDACSHLPSEYVHECDKIVDEYTPEIVEYILDDVVPDLICTYLELCLGAPTITAGDDQECQICEAILAYVENFISENSTEEEIKEALDKACSWLPSVYADQCKALVDQYEQDIINLIVNDMPPKKVCTYLDLCKQSAEVKSSEFCAACEFIMQWVEHWISENSTEEEIKDILDKACEWVPKADKDKCQEIIASYESQIIEFLLNDLPPKKICEALGLCSDSMHEEITENADDYVCIACEWAMEFIEEEIVKSEVQSEIIEPALEKICKKLPDDLEAACDKLVVDFEPKIAEYLVNKYPPGKVCKAVKACA